MRLRLLVAAAVLVTEAVITSILVDGDQLAGRGGAITELLRNFGALSVRFTLLFLVLLGASFLVRPDSLPDVKRFAAWRRWLVHAACLFCFAVLTFGLYRGGGHTIYPDLLAGLWAAAGAAVAATAMSTAIPARSWLPLIYKMRRRVGGVALLAATACWLGALSERLWEPARWATFRLVEAVLRPLIPSLNVQPERFRIGAGRFGVIIAPECSGLEGIGLLLVFGLLWTIAYRREIGFVRCGMLLGGGIVLLYGLNVVRIASLVLIGYYGSPQIAKAGFHSQAGWIAFSTVALGLTFVARHLGERPLRESGAELHNPAAPLLVPFLGVVAASMIAGATSGGFEWLYGLRVLAAGMALWHYREDLRCLRWPAPSALAIAMGAVVFGIWMALEAVVVGPVQLHQAAPAQFVAAAAVNQWAWLVVRVIGAVIVVPVVEELAFRAYLMRRIQAEEFERVDLRRFSWLAVGGSSLIFGVLHGQRWFAGVLAGVIYAWTLTRRGAISDAVYAHAVTNGLISVLVLAMGAWNLW